MKIYAHRGFKVTNIHGDGEFEIEDLKKEMSPAEMIIYAKNKHVPIIEQSVRTVKGRARTACNAAPYNKYTTLMIQHLIESRVSWLNRFPSKNGISQTLSPATLVLGHPKPDMNGKRLPFGAYVIVYQSTTNDMNSRGTPAIALSEDNGAGGHFFMLLHSGRKIHAFSWEELPVHDDVIQRVEELATDEQQPELQNKSPLFEWNPGYEILDLPHDSVDVLEANIDLANEDNDRAIDDLDDEDETVENPVITDDEEEYIINNEEEIIKNANNENEMNGVNHEFDKAHPTEDEVFLNQEDHDDHEDEDEKSRSDNITYEHEEDQNEEPLPPRNDGRERRNGAGTGVERYEPSMKEKSYELNRKQQFLQFKRKKKNVQLAQVKRLMQKVRSGQNAPSYLKRAVNVVFAQMTNEDGEFAQMSAKKGIKKFSQEAIAAMIKEFTQFNDGVMPGNPVVEPVDPTTLTPDDIAKALEAVNLIKKKRSGIVKGRSCLNGSQQWKYLGENESIASPTSQLEALFLSLIIDVMEKRDVAVFDIPGAYLHTEIPEDKKVLMKLRDEFVDIMCTVNPQHTKNIVYENGRKVLYIRVLRAVYRAIESALLWYNLYRDTLLELGFEVNPYDKCVANKVINGSQCTIVWYVDDNKVSHVDPKVVDEILKIMEKKFGKLTVTRGSKHTYLGMNINLRNDNRFEVDMRDQLEETIQLFGEEIVPIITSPAAKHLMLVPDDDEEISESKQKKFHSIVAKLLYLMKRARPDLEPAVSFLCTRVTKCGLSDWKKLQQILAYIKGTIDDKRIIGASSLNEILMFVDAAYAIYDDMRGQTGGCMSMGWGVFHGRSSKQRINTKSLTETELVGVGEYIPYNIWAVSFLSSQGYSIDKNVLFQDNQSAMLMERNGRTSCTRNSRHINVRYFFIKDRIDKGEISVDYCPTYLMLADYFTKPLQGKMFQLFRNIIMGYLPISSIVEQIPIKELLMLIFKM